MSKLEWSQTLCDGKHVNYADAEKAAESLGEGWRLPTRLELESILDLSRHDPAIDTDVFPDTESDWYWSSTPTAWNPSAVWIVSFSGGGVLDDPRLSGACARAVRSLEDV